MCILHQYGRWSELTRHVSAFSGVALMQQRQCQRCGKIKTRTVAYLDADNDDSDEIGQ